MQRLVRALLVLAAATLVYGSLYPWEWREPIWRELTYRPPFGRSGQLDVVLNILVYMPLGVLAAIGFRSWWARGVAWGTISAMSLAIEYTQLWIRTRNGNLSDFYFNSLGTLFGLLCGVWLEKRLRVERLAKVWRRDPAAWFLLVLWMVWQLFPFVPSARFAKLDEFRRVWSAPSFSFLEMGDSLAVGLTLGILTKVVNVPWAWVPVTGILLARGWIATNTLPLMVFVLTLVGFAVPRRFRLPAGLAASVLVTWVLLRELYPFAFSRVATNFQWGVFTSLLEAERSTAMRTLLGKLFLYGSTGWMLQAAGWRLWMSGLFLGTLLLVCEWLQRYLRGRTAEFTDVVLVVVALAALRVVRTFRG